ncbi:MAG: nuclear transport factor 2 family protein [Planctomycetota bacterium]|nr:nuclear transport factor 2 family protein [Planctomycetota bacterium]
MTSQMPGIAKSYVRSVNDRDPAAFIALFGVHAVVDDAGRAFRGLAEIKEWGNREIFAARVTLEVMNCVGGEEEATVTAKVDGEFDRAGLPDPVVINHHIRTEGGKIVALACRLAGDEANSGVQPAGQE